MSYESKLDNHSGKFISPTQLCLLLSVALHLLVLRFGLPTIRSNNDSGRREVSIIELNPEQQSRLPDLSPQLDTPDIPNISNLPEPDSSEPVAPFAIPPSLIPGVGDNSNLPALTIPPPPEFDLPPLPPQTDITLPPIGDISALPLPPQIDPSDFKADPIELPPNTGKTPPPPSDSTTERQAPQPTTTTKPKPEETKPEPQPRLTPEQIAAKKLADSQERIRNLRASLTETKAGTTDEDARKNYVAWLAKVEEIEPDKIEIEGTYPRDACIRRLEGTSVFGVVTNEQGQIVALDLIKGAKYALFNQQASQELGDRTLDNPTDKPKPYQVTVNYKYDAEICPSLTLPSIRNQQQPQSKPQPQPAPEAETTPEPQPEPQPAPEAETTPALEPAPEAETTPEPQPEPQPAPEAETTPEPQPEPQPKPEAETTPEPQPEPQPKPEAQPSLRDRLRDVPLPDLDPAKFKGIPLPDRPNLRD